MIPLSLEEIAALCPGRLDAAPWAEEVTGVQVDSRRIEEGDLFVAVGGGEDFTRHAFARGAAATLVPEDAFAGLAAIGSAVRSRSSARVVGITGSTGKTSTKDILAAMCRPHAKTVAAEGGHNNEIGLPLTLARIDEDTEVVVCEMGMRGIGQIAELCAIARPQVGVITSIGPSAPRAARHGREGGGGQGRGRRRRCRRAERRSCPTSRSSSRTSIAATSRSTASAPRTWSRSSASTTVAGSSSRSRRAARARVSVHRPPPGAERCRGTPRDPRARPAVPRRKGGRRAVSLAWRGISAPGRRPADQRRLQREPGLDAGRSRAPCRARRAARSRCSGTWPSWGRRRRNTIATSGELVRALGIDAVLSVGELARDYGGEHARDAAEAAEKVTELVQPGDVVLVKGSRAVGLEVVAEALTGVAA